LKKQIASSFGRKARGLRITRVSASSDCEAPVFVQLLLVTVVSAIISRWVYVIQPIRVTTNIIHSQRINQH
jgi:hypothetical protein